MTKEKIKPAEKLAQGKAASKSANKKAVKNKINKEAKKLAEKAVMDIAANLPAGEGNAFILGFLKYREAVQHRRAANKEVSNARAELKAIKIDMSCFDRVFKLFEMDPSDVAAKKANEALYEQQLNLRLSDEQKDIIADINVKRENSRAAMSDLNNGEAGKEVGSGTDEEQTTKKALPTLPERNDSIGKAFSANQAKIAGSASTH